jgi:hypothetical protein
MCVVLPTLPIRFGGQHFEFSNQTGLAIGRNVADEVLSTRLLRRSGPIHVGECPR